MYAVVWEYAVAPDRVDAFEAAYGAGGAWEKLFAEAEGYLGTDLYQAAGGGDRYVTIDRWRSLADFDAFKARFGEAYAALDAQCEALTTSELRLGEIAG